MSLYRINNSIHHVCTIMHMHVKVHMPIVHLSMPHVMHLNIAAQHCTSLCGFHCTSKPPAERWHILTGVLPKDDTSWQYIHKGHRTQRMLCKGILVRNWKWSILHVWLCTCTSTHMPINMQILHVIHLNIAQQSNLHLCCGFHCTSKAPCLKMTSWQVYCQKMTHLDNT